MAAASKTRPLQSAELGVFDSIRVKLTDLYLRISQTQFMDDKITNVIHLIALHDKSQPASIR